jgi:hypothetical protein
MFCPGCSAPSADGAKFCKICGMNLTIVTQALVGSVVVTDPLRDREYKRARKSISEGIQGTAIGASLMVAAALIYFLLPHETFFYGAALAIGLLGIIYFFRSVGRIVDAKLGPKLLDPALRPRGTGPLSEGTGPLPSRPNQNSSRRLPSDPLKSNPPAPAQASARLPVNDKLAVQSLAQIYQESLLKGPENAAESATNDSPDRTPAKGADRNPPRGPLKGPLESPVSGANGAPNRSYTEGLSRSHAEGLQKATPKGNDRPPQPLGAVPPPRIGTGRVNREHSSHLREPDKQDDILSKIRN